MEYTFGTETNTEVVKIVSDEPFEAEGNYNLVREYSDVTRTDMFHIVRKIREAESAGKYYKWYEISNYCRYDMPKIKEPYTATKTAYIGDSEVVFMDTPEGNLSVYIKDSEGNYPSYTVERISDRIRVSFEPVEYVTEVTISII